LSNFIFWSSNPFETYPTGNVATPGLGQSLSNLGDEGQHLVYGAFFLWLSVGALSPGLKCLALLCSSLSALGLFGAYLHVHKVPQLAFPASRLKTCSTLTGALGVLSWAGHLTHVCLPQQSLLPAGMAAPRGFLAELVPRLDVHEFTGPCDGAVSAELIASHHVSIGAACIGLCGVHIETAHTLVSCAEARCAASLLSLAVALGSLGSLAIAVSFTLPFAPCYRALGSAFPTVWALFSHHFWLGILALAGAASHLALCCTRLGISSPPLGLIVLSQRETLIGHLTWVRAFLGAHSVGALLHNDSMEALGRNDDSFSDAGMPVRPMILTAPLAPSLGSADCLIFHVDSFCLHTAALVLAKGVLVSRSSRLISAKGVLGFTYPCDGPGRGGTCQISPWDHVFLGALWAYNTGSVGPFHFLWYAQSVLWAQLDDWAVSASSINGWLTSLLWTESAKVLEAYGTPFCGYSLVFLTGHFAWALSLMFLFTGRGYWQELVESVMWAHYKLHLVPVIQPRALSITTGRAVGLTHYLAGSIGASWAFSTCRLV
jgi:photosystem I P700 chlorophyll a apoprotein A1